jgi:MFS family permease
LSARDDGAGANARRRSLSRNLKLFYLFRLLATSYLYVPIFMAFEKARGLSPFEKLALGGVYSAVVIAVQVPMGVFADRIGRRRSMIVGPILMVASCLLAVRANGFGEFAIAEALAAISMTACSGADSAYLFDLLRQHDVAHEYARRESIASAWHLIGSAAAFAGGGLLATIDDTLPYYVTAGVAALATVIAYRLEEDPPRASSRARADGAAAPVREAMASWGREMVGALAEVIRNPRLAWLVGYSAVVFVLLRATIYVYQPYLEDRGLGAAEIGFLFAGVYVVASLVAHRTHALRRRFGDNALLWGLLAALAISFVGLAGTARGPWMLALLLVQAVANGIYSPLTKPLLNHEIADSSRRASVLSVESMARRAAMGVFSPLVGLYGESDVMLLCGVVGLVGLVVLAVTRSRRRPAPAGSSLRAAAVVSQVPPAASPER